MKTSELIGSALDWAVAKCEGVNPTFNMKSHGSTWHGWWVANPIYRRMPHYSTNWAQGGPILDREKIGLEFMDNFEAWSGSIVREEGQDRENYSDDQDRESYTVEQESFVGYGPTPLIAAMRCYVASKLGDEVDIPKELLGEQ